MFGCREEEFALPPPQRGYQQRAQRGYTEQEPYQDVEDFHDDQQRIALGQSPSNGGGYGSPEADKAAARLQQLGVTVSPPGRSGAVDWQSLAGKDNSF